MMENCQLASPEVALEELKVTLRGNNQFETQPYSLSTRKWVHHSAGLCFGLLPIIYFAFQANIILLQNLNKLSSNCVKF